ncbi:MAG: bifunctional ADP-dependent NAD(P)H-hydrate dehydratase/NAD(P)H-hydrate epimerase, partial [Clostridiales bacterium]|nr:bifunctional ADP-dependent NAD(P)H-hydrate dehydratase/NAD(P)H-hydrate epimerase [Clostridiales bacterium]
CILVLKGHRTMTALPDGTVYINTTGGPAMAKGGTGDVLAGMITSLIGQKFPLKDAVLAAVFLHGLAGDMCAGQYGDYSVTAGGIISMLPLAIKSVISNT